MVQSVAGQQETVKLESTCVAGPIAGCSQQSPSQTSTLKSPEEQAGETEHQRSEPQCWRCYQDGHLGYGCRIPEHRIDKSHLGPRCWSCGQFGHRKSRCPYFWSSSTSRKDSRGVLVARGPLCKEDGFTGQFWEIRQPWEKGSTHFSSSATSGRLPRDLVGQGMEVEVQLNGQSCCALLDTGSFF